eukprot:11228312-Lingulodinium_polyedra.AAC.2
MKQVDASSHNLKPDEASLSKLAQLSGRTFTGLLRGSKRIRSRPNVSSRPSTCPSRSFWRGASAGPEEAHRVARRAPRVRRQGHGGLSKQANIGTLHGQLLHHVLERRDPRNELRALVAGGLHAPAQLFDAEETRVHDLGSLLQNRVVHLAALRGELVGELLEGTLDDLNGRTLDRALRVLQPGIQCRLQDELAATVAPHVGLDGCIGKGRRTATASKQGKKRRPTAAKENAEETPLHPQSAFPRDQSTARAPRRPRAVGNKAFQGGLPRPPKPHGVWPYWPPGDAALHKFLLP